MVPGFKLYHRKTAQESLMQRIFDSSNSVCLQLVGNAIHSSYRCRTITAVALKQYVKITAKLTNKYSISNKRANPMKIQS